MLQSHPTSGSRAPRNTGLCRPLLLAALMLAGVSHAFACDRPTFSDAIPDGSKATEQEMANIQQAIRQFVSDSEAYIECIDGTRNPRVRNEVIDEMEKVAAAFNRELRKFRRRK